MAKQRSRDPEATREALLNAAEEVFLKKGFGAAAMSEIARRAGLTKSLIHHYFGSKRGIWNEVKQRRFTQYAADQMALLKDAAPTEDLLRGSMQLYFMFLQNNPELVRILAWMFLEQDTDQCVHVDQEVIETGTAKIREAQEEGLLRRDIDPRFIVFTFIGLAQHWFQDRDHFISDFGIDELPEDLDQAYLDAMTKIFFEGVVAK
ncbi:MAG: TetR/AcrR family transcriptional regulator [Desulfobacterales bacterium]|nr:TetR/AcrR family transcriptional regulator [Desulfobacterales bacterium]